EGKCAAKIMPHLLDPLDNRHQETGHAGIAGDLQVEHRLDLRIDIPHTCRDHRRPAGTYSIVEEHAGRGHMIGGRINNDITLSKPGCIYRLPEPADALDLMRSIDRSGGDEDPLDLCQGNSQKSPEGRSCLLESDKVPFSGDGQFL